MKDGVSLVKLRTTWNFIKLHIWHFKGKTILLIITINTLSA